MYIRIGILINSGILIMQTYVIQGTQTNLAVDVLEQVQEGWLMPFLAMGQSQYLPLHQWYQSDQNVQIKTHWSVKMVALVLIFLHFSFSPNDMLSRSFRHSSFPASWTRPCLSLAILKTGSYHYHLKGRRYKRSRRRLGRSHSASIKGGWVVHGGTIWATPVRKWSRLKDTAMDASIYDSSGARVLNVNYELILSDWVRMSSFDIFVHSVQRRHTVRIDMEGLGDDISPYTEWDHVYLFSLLQVVQNDMSDLHVNTVKFSEVKLNSLHECTWVWGKVSELGHWLREATPTCVWVDLILIQTKWLMVWLNW